MATQKDLRRALGFALDDLEVYTVLAATSAYVTAVGLVNLTPNASVNRYNAAYVYAGSTAEQKRVQTGGYDPATGKLTYASLTNVPTLGTEIDVTRLFPATTAEIVGATTSYTTLLNKALAKLLVPDRLTVAIATSNLISLATYAAWLDRPDRLLRVLEPPPIGNRPISAAWRGWRLVVDGGTPVLQFDAPFLVASGNLTLEVLRPASTLISGGESTVGLVTDAQTAPAATEDVVALGLMEAYRDLMNRQPGQPGSQYLAKFQDARERAEQLFYFDGAYYRPKQYAPPRPAAA